MIKFGKDKGGGWVVREVTVGNPNGLHVRPATDVAKIALTFDCDVMIEKDGLRVSAKSVMGLLNLGAQRGSRLRVIADGPGASEVVQRIEQVMNRDYEDQTPPAAGAKH